MLLSPMLLPHDCSHHAFIILYVVCSALFALSRRFPCSVRLAFATLACLSPSIPFASNLGQQQIGDVSLLC
jgi:hypothetical protein